MSTGVEEQDRQAVVAVSSQRTLRGRRVIHAGAEVAPALGEIAGTLRLLGYCKRDVFAVSLALEEAVVNALVHGNKLDACKSVRIHFSANHAGIVIQVRDEGAGFDRRQVPDPLAAENLERSSGRGLLLMHSFMTKVRYNRLGNCVTLVKAPTASPSTDPGTESCSDPVLEESDG